ncbi:MAG: hypothetical protein ACK4GN_14060 [Runella sp.]
MKTLIASVFALLVSLSAVANDENRKETLRTAAFPVENGYYLKVIVEKPLNERVEVRMLDDRNRTVMNTNIHKKDRVAHLKLDISELSGGEYKLMFVNGDQVKVKNIKIGTTDPSRPITISVM